MKAILISIKPKWVAKILNGEKTIEIRKTMPKCDLPIDVYIYCTKCDIKGARENFTFEQLKLLGKVVAKFTMYGCIPMKPKYIKNWKTHLDNACLTEEEYLEYSNGKATYQWVVDNLVIFNRPKELSEFDRCILTEDLSHDNIIHIHQRFKITKAPQSWQFIEVEK